MLAVAVRADYWFSFLLSGAGWEEAIALISILAFILPERIKCQSVANCHHHGPYSKNVPAFFAFLALVVVVGLALYLPVRDVRPVE